MFNLFVKFTQIKLVMEFTNCGLSYTITNIVRTKIYSSIYYIDYII